MKHAKDTSTTSLVRLYDFDVSHAEDAVTLHSSILPQSSFPFYEEEIDEKPRSDDRISDGAVDVICGVVPDECSPCDDSKNVRQKVENEAEVESTSSTKWTSSSVELSIPRVDTGDNRHKSAQVSRNLFQITLRRPDYIGKELEGRTEQMRSKRRRGLCAIVGLLLVVSAFIAIIAVGKNYKEKEGQINSDFISFAGSEAIAQEKVDAPHRLLLYHDYASDDDNADAIEEWDDLEVSRYLEDSKNVRNELIAGGFPENSLPSNSGTVGTVSRRRRSRHWDRMPCPCCHLGKTCAIGPMLLCCCLWGR